MSPAALDAAYENAPHIPGAADYPPRWAARAAVLQEKLGPRARTGLRYGEGGRETFDLLSPEGAVRGLAVFVHGGYWRAFAPSDWTHLAAGPLAHGFAAALIGYPLAPGARIRAITRHVARGIDRAAETVPGPVHLAGHSAGGHLVLRMLCADVPLACRARIASCVPISPVTDLRPLLGTRLNEDLRLDAQEAGSESPALQAPAPLAEPVPVRVHVGASERPAFLWQARALGSGWAARVHEAPGRHHFDVIDALEDPGSRLVADLLRPAP